jgi:hypothetical protein
MKKIIALIAIGGSMFWAYQSGAIARSGSGYRVEYAGTPGAKLYGSYGWMDMTGKKPMHIEKVAATLPYSVSFNPPANSMVTAAASTLNQGSVTVKIFKGGVECGQPAIEGSGAMTNKVCKP